VIGGQRVDGFIGAYPEEVVERFVASLLPTEGEQELARLVANGDEASLRQALELEPGHPDAVLALAELLIDDGRTDEALALLARLPETEPVRLLAARARLGQSGIETNGVDAVPSDDFDDKLENLLPLVRDDEAARQEFVDILEVMGPDDPRTAQYRRQLTSRLF
jgi:putative thioredoxin